ncbi:hypothetical protein MMC11_004830 [Xylographa trunciseda]|nr:hypothetical protein [Xylographa trunciseda]
MPFYNQTFPLARPQSSQHRNSFAEKVSLSSPTSRAEHKVMDFFHHKEGKDKRKSVSGSPKLGPAKPAKLEIGIESPPLVLYGPIASSTGALLSGQLILSVSEDEVQLQHFEMQLLAKTTTKKPVSKDCPDCRTQTCELFKWKFLSELGRFPRGRHSFPFSYLLPGKLPATTNSGLGAIDYVLSAKAVTPLQDNILVESPLKVYRALLPGNDRTSLRIFPPTNITATIILPPVIHPIGEFNVQMRIAGCAENEGTTQRRWRIRKMNTRIEEHTKMISPPCPKHVHKVGGEGKGILSTETRVLNIQDYKDGWKSDFDTHGGLIEMEFPASIKPSSHPICDVDAPTGLSVTHNLVLELIVAEEVVSLKNTKFVTPTGTARVLRMQFVLILTERSGLGISWDEEQPPMYDDVPASPPSYAKMIDYEGEPLPDDELARLS